MNNLKQVILPLLCTFIGFNARSQGIIFEQGQSWSQLKAKAKSEGKYILIDTYTTWCGPCKAMSKDVFTKKEVGDFLNNRFISVKVQIDQTKSDDESVKAWYTDAKYIDQQYKITAYPTILFFSPDATLIGRSVGYKDANELIVETKKVIANSEEFNTSYEQYKSGKRDPGFVKSFAELGLKMGRIAISTEIAQQYINSLNDRELFKKDNLQFVNQFTRSSNSKGFQLFRKEPKKINAILGSNTAEVKIREIIVKEEVNPFVKNKTNVSNWEIIERKIKNKYGSLGLEAYYGERMLYFFNKKEWACYGKYYALYYTTAFSRSSFHINNMSWQVFEYINDPKVLEVAIKTMRYDNENFDRNNCYSYDTYANLLYKVGKIDEAILWESKAVQIEEENASKGNRKPDPVFKETLQKMNMGTPTWPLAEPRK